MTTARARRVASELVKRGMECTSVAALAAFVELIDDGEPEEELVSTILDWRAEIWAEADARKLASDCIERARRGGHRPS